MLIKLTSHHTVLYVDAYSVPGAHSDIKNTLVTRYIHSLYLGSLIILKDEEALNK